MVLPFKTENAKRPKAHSLALAATNRKTRAILQAIGLAVAGTLPATVAHGELLLARTVMPDAAPSSFAVALPNGTGFCFDPVRGGLSYAWQGGFVDLTPAQPGLGKFIKPANLPGGVAYRETGHAPLRRGDRTHVPAIVFKGYRLRPEAVEFAYTVDGILVREEIRARAAGDGLVRHFRIDPADSDTRWWYVPGPTEGAVPASPSGRFEDGALRFDAGAAREFTIEVVFAAKP